MNAPISFHDKSLVPVWQKVRHGERLTLEDGLTLYGTRDLISLGKMAHAVQQELSGDAVYFVLNQKIEHTNVCVLSCRFCNFAARKGDADAYEMTTEEILAKLTPEIAEVHITAGMPPDWPWERYLEIVRTIHERLPNADVKAFTAVEIDFFHKKFKMPIQEVLRQLKEAGLKTMPGGGAEIFSERVRRLLFNQKIGAKTWLDIHRTAHRMGIPTNSTMLYGHIETMDERLIHMIKLRELQDETGGFLTFVPLAFLPGDTGIKPRERFTSAIDDLKTIAVSRLMLDNIDNIQVSWVTQGAQIAQVALGYGANDFGSTMFEENVVRAAGTSFCMDEAELRRQIRNAGYEPRRRNTYYQLVD
jgi:aminodeoxyfutalosine synthase